ncbi:hypothetical protein G4B88_013196 [Cannabis sativa]|uniref:Ubiquitin-like protease family profile domain-containing protein n=1 Tax=Cannabis sativa TaxID=3483 RepID=A0A7J6H1S5_CANSA|nr:hypothetical protein G4B88_013196 [Cannabis sativa]
MMKDLLAELKQIKKELSKLFGHLVSSHANGSSLQLVNEALISNTILHNFDEVSVTSTTGGKIFEESTLPSAYEGYYTDVVPTLFIEENDTTTIRNEALSHSTILLLILDEKKCYHTDVIDKVSAPSIRKPKTTPNKDTMTPSTGNPPNTGTKRKTDVLGMPIIDLAKKAPKVGQEKGKKSISVPIVETWSHCSEHMVKGMTKYARSLMSTRQMLKDLLDVAKVVEVEKERTEKLIKALTKQNQEYQLQGGAFNDEPQNNDNFLLESLFEEFVKEKLASMSMDEISRMVVILDGKVKEVELEIELHGRGRNDASIGIEGDEEAEALSNEDAPEPYSCEDLISKTRQSDLGKGKSPVKVLPSSGVSEEIPLKLRNLTPTSVERLSLSLTDFFSGETTPEAVKFKIKGGSKPAGQPGLMGSSSSTAHENVSRVEFEEFKKCLSVVVSQQGILMKSVAEMNKKLDILIENSETVEPIAEIKQPDQSQGGEENIDVNATIASAVKAVENLIGSSTHAPAPVETSEKTDLEMVVFQETPILRPQKRDRKKGAVLKSPFIELASGASKSGSSSVSPDDSVYKVVKYVRGLCPLDNKIGEPVDPQLEADFVKWVDSGLRKHKSNTTTNVYCKGKDTIFPPFRFGVEDISNKMWFHNLAYPNCFLTNSHIDIIFYYLRKKIMYSAEPKIKVTTTDCLFCSSITTLYERFVEKNNDISVLSLSHNVAQYIQGGKILCATPWHLVDHVIMPINVKLQDHWICGRLNIVDRRIYLYNSLRSGRYMTAAKEACKPFSVILPYYFSMLDFKGLRNETKFSTMEPFPIVAVDGLPEQYGMKKQTENIESESEAPPSLPKK